MTFIAPAQPAGSLADVIRPLAQLRRLSVPSRRRSADEDGARRALGMDGLAPVALLPGTSIEHLARIAFG